MIGFKIKLFYWITDSIVTCSLLANIIILLSAGDKSKTSRFYWSLGFSICSCFFYILTIIINIRTKLRQSYCKIVVILRVLSLIFNIIFIISIDKMVIKKLVIPLIIVGYLTGTIIIVNFIFDPCFREYIRAKRKFFIKTNQIVKNEETKLSLITKTDTEDKKCVQPMYEDFNTL